ncbi:hypothetical protein SGRA_0045 [Saprospira grandis str. Lewin]|uniref:Uncharacterized protein n=1 Tax=Saprospira grandis (strain Lewin) TaxID=984262 RepID=H6L4B1_SAPGL|nr:hypothetical protein SGRA_0045 [Saprospira grandis str. Lewin]
MHLNTPSSEVFFGGLPPAAAGLCQGSQVCSALRKIRYAHFAWSAASPPPYPSLGRLAFGHP